MAGTFTGMDGGTQTLEVDEEIGIVVRIHIRDKGLVVKDIPQPLLVKKI